MTENDDRGQTADQTRLWGAGAATALRLAATCAATARSVFAAFLCCFRVCMRNLVKSRQRWSSKAAESEMWERRRKIAREKPKTAKTTSYRIPNKART